MAQHPLVQLTLVRVREFMREPEAVFWAVLFPILLTSGLGLAFRSRPQPVLTIAAAPALVETLRTEPGLDVVEASPEAAAQALRTGDRRARRRARRERRSRGLVRRHES